MVESYHRHLFLQGPAGRLEAMLWTVSGPNPALAALVCHPHPLFGGTMHNKVVFRVAKVLHQHGAPVLRFNFRGAGLSEGQHDRGRGEEGDVETAIGYVSRSFPEARLLLAGFSFGAWVGLRAGCRASRVHAVIGLGLPVNDSDLSFLQSCRKPKFFVQGSRDQYGEQEKVEALFAALPEPKKLAIIEGADHFFTGLLDPMAAELDAWLGEQSFG